jgi:hypothetical protein
MKTSSSPSDGSEPPTIGTEKKMWIDLINKSVHTNDDIDIGDIHAVSRDFVVVKRGIVNIHYYYIPISKVEGWDGNVLWLKITESEVQGKYERDKVPDPLFYYVKDYPYYTSIYYPELQMIPSRYTRTNYPTTSFPSSDVPRLYKCGSCKEVFKSEEELSNHVESVAH